MEFWVEIILWSIYQNKENLTFHFKNLKLWCLKFYVSIFTLIMQSNFYDHTLSAEQAVYALAPSPTHSCAQLDISTSNNKVVISRLSAEKRTQRIFCQEQSLIWNSSPSRIILSYLHAPLKICHAHGNIHKQRNIQCSRFYNGNFIWRILVTSFNKKSQMEIFLMHSGSFS